MNIRDRIIELLRVPASSVRPCPMNWRTHGDEQRNALRGVLAEVGFAGAILARKLANGDLEAIDGHLRLEEAGAAEVPVLVTDLTESEARLLLATYDPISRMAGTSADRLDALLREVETDSVDVVGLIEAIAAEAGVDWANVPQEPSGDRAAASGSAAKGDTEEAAEVIPEQFNILIRCKDEAEQVKLLEKFKRQKLDCKAQVS